MSKKEGLERYTCKDCRELIGNRDFASLKGTYDAYAQIIETYHCIDCCIKSIKSTTFEEAVKGHMILTWYGKTWSFEIQLYKEKSWNEVLKGLEDGDLFPEDVLFCQPKMRENIR